MVKWKVTTQPFGIIKFYHAFLLVETDVPKENKENVEKKNSRQSSEDSKANVKSSQNSNSEAAP